MSSNPESYIEILHDGNRLATFNNTSDLTYDIARSKCEDAGVYTCSAINEVNPEPTTVALDFLWSVTISSFVIVSSNLM